MRPTMRAFQLLATGFVVMAPLLCGCASQHPRDAEGPKLTMDDLPATAARNFRRDHPAAAVTLITKEIEDGVTHYVIRFQEGAGKEQRTEYNREGDETSD